MWEVRWHTLSNPIRSWIDIPLPDLGLECYTYLLTGAHKNFDTPPPPSMTQKFIHNPFRLDQDIEERASRVSVQHHRHSSRFPPSQ